MKQQWHFLYFFVCVLSKLFLTPQKLTHIWFFTPFRILVVPITKKKPIQNPPIPPTYYLYKRRLYNLNPIISDPIQNSMLDQIGQSHNNNNILPTPSSVLAASAISKRSKNPQFFVLPPQVHHHKQIPQKSQKEYV